MRVLKKTILLAVPALMLSKTATAFACAACYGKSDAPMAQGMNWGIMVLLGVIGMVLTGITGFFVYVAKRPGLPVDSTEGSAEATQPDRASTDTL